MLWDNEQEKQCFVLLAALCFDLADRIGGRPADRPEENLSRAVEYVSQSMKEAASNV